jgi:hypothetical protein
MEQSASTSVSFSFVDPPISDLPPSIRSITAFLNVLPFSMYSMQCGANKKYFVEETETLSGFKVNQNYGLGGNSLTAGQKSSLIFGGLFLGFLVFMSGYLME